MCGTLTNQHSIHTNPGVDVELVCTTTHARQQRCFAHGPLQPIGAAIVALVIIRKKLHDGSRSEKETDSHLRKNHHNQSFLSSQCNSISTASKSQCHSIDAIVSTRYVAYTRYNLPTQTCASRCHNIHMVDDCDDPHLRLARPWLLHCHPSVNYAWCSGSKGGMSQLSCPSTRHTGETNNLRG